MIPTNKEIVRIVCPSQPEWQELDGNLVGQAPAFVSGILHGSLIEFRCNLILRYFSDLSVMTVSGGYNPVHITLEEFAALSGYEVGLVLEKYNTRYWK